jgi:Zn-dependent protease with chaperone function
MNTARITSNATALGLYTITFAGQLVAAFARLILIYFPLALLGVITGWPIPANTIALVLALAPLAVSLLALLCPWVILPLDGRWWEISSGGRPPEADELDAFEEAITQLQNVDPGLRVPKHWFVAEDPGQNAAAYAQTMCIERGLLESPYAAGVIAHELGHLNSSDARLSSALNLMVVAPLQKPKFTPLWSLPLRGLAWLASGQAILLFMSNPWEMYWRSREFAADTYARQLGQGPALARSLEHDSLPHEQPILRMRFSRTTHPYTKPRIAQLRAQPKQAPGEHR